MIKTSVKVSKGKPFRVLTKDQMAAMVADLEGIVRARMAERRGPDGPWPEYSEEYQRTHQGAADLQETGALNASIKPGKVSPRKGYLVAGVEYAAPVNKLRPFLCIAPEEADELLDTFIRAFDANVARANATRIPNG